jgi:outer membrane lipoprotein SlyB
MRGNAIRSLLLPLVLAAGLGACASNAVQPGIVYTSGAPSGAYGGGPYGPGSYQAGPYNSGGPYGGAQRVSSTYPGQGTYPNQGAYPNQGTYPNYPAQGSNSGAIGGTGRVVSIREVSLAGPGGGGGGNGAVIGGVLGAGAGATIGAITSQSLGGGIVGALIGMVGGAIAGTIADGQRGSGRGIEVTVQKDDGQQVTVAQPDDGDVQLGDRVQIVQNRQGVAQVVRQTARSADTSGAFQPMQ